jgi:hypothetical protein
VQHPALISLDDLHRHKHPALLMLHPMHLPKVACACNTASTPPFPTLCTQRLLVRKILELGSTQILLDRQVVLWVRRPCFAQPSPHAVLPGSGSG